MEIYIDTANLDEIKAAAKLSILDGVTTNPTILSKQDLNPKEIIGKINKLVDGKIWYQVTGTKCSDMIAEALQVCNVIDKPVIKLPMGKEALNACSTLSNEGIETNVTLVFSLTQALLAAKSGATYISPYVGRINDTGWSGYSFIKDIVNMFNTQSYTTKVIGASLRGNHDVVEMAMLGAKAVTMPYHVFNNLFSHPMSDIGRKQFDSDWATYQKQFNNF